MEYSNQFSSRFAVKYIEEELKRENKAIFDYLSYEGLKIIKKLTKQSKLKFSKKNKVIIKPAVEIHLNVPIQ